MVDSVRGAQGGYRLRREPANIHRDAAAHILDHTTLANLIVDSKTRDGKGGKRTKKQKNATSILPTVVGGAKGD